MLSFLPKRSCKLVSLHNFTSNTTPFGCLSDIFLSVALCVEIDCRRLLICRKTEWNGWMNLFFWNLIIIIILKFSKEYTNYCKYIWKFVYLNAITFGVIKIICLELVHIWSQKIGGAKNNISLFIPGLKARESTISFNVQFWWNNRECLSECVNVRNSPKVWNRQALNPQ
jgi:hypothetical protein